MKELFGRVLKPQGLSGELKVMPASVVEGLKKVTVSGKDYQVVKCSYRNKFCYLKLKGVLTVGAAEQFRAVEIFYERADEKLDEGTYYIADLVGSAVLLDNVYLGTVSAVGAYGAADVITIKGAKGEVRVPHLKKLVLSFDASSKILTLSEEVFHEVAVYED